MAFYQYYLEFIRQVRKQNLLKRYHDVVFNKNAHMFFFSSHSTRVFPLNLSDMLSFYLRFIMYLIAGGLFDL